jgi:hypothetical protein
MGAHPRFEEISTVNPLKSEVRGTALAAPVTVAVREHGFVVHPRARVALAAFALIVGAGFVAIVGAGCSSNEPSSTPITAGPPPLDVPAAANPRGLKVGGKVKSAAIIDQLTAALNADSDVKLLVGKYQQLGFPWAPTSTDFIAEVDSDGSSLVGISHRRHRPDDPKETGWLIALFPLSASPFSHPRYLYLETYEQGATPPLSRYWIDKANQVQSLAFPPSGQTFRLPALPAGDWP